jgi:hypothetical protein
MYYQNSQNMVNIKLESSDVNVVELHLAEFRESTMHAIPQIFIFLVRSQGAKGMNIHRLVPGPAPFLELSVPGTISNFLS